jgi:hypothetical protein
MSSSEEPSGHRARVRRNRSPPGRKVASSRILRIGSPWKSTRLIRPASSCHKSIARRSSPSFPRAPPGGSIGRAAPLAWLQDCDAGVIQRGDFGTAGDAEFREHVVDVRLDGAHGQDQTLRDLSVGQLFRYEHGYFVLAPAEHGRGRARQQQRGSARALAVCGERAASGSSAVRRGRVATRPWAREASASLSAA